MEIKIASIENAKDILEIYSYYILNTNFTFEYEKPTLKEFEARISSTLNKFPYLILVENEKIIGFCYATTHYPRRGYDWNAVLSVYLDKNVVSRGYGTILYQKLIEILKIQNIVNIYACIVSENTVSIKMHEKLGFTQSAIFENTGYKNNTWLSIVWLHKRIGSLQTPQKFLPFSEVDKNIILKILCKNN